MHNALDVENELRTVGHWTICVCMFFFTLKDPVPIDLHYMTDRLQQFELNIFACVLLKKQSPTSLMPCRGYADKHHIFIFG